MEIDYSKFTDRSKNAISRALSLTKRCQYAEVEPQVMLVAILQESRYMIPFMLHEMNVDKDSFLTSVSNSMSSISHRISQEHHLSQSLRLVLQKSCDLAQQDGNDDVALEYIFQALGEVNNPVKDIMVEYGINPVKLRQVVNLFRIYRNNDTMEELVYDTDTNDFIILDRYDKDFQKIDTINTVYGPYPGWTEGL